MKRETNKNSRWKQRVLVMLATAAALTALLFTSPVEAAHRQHKHYKPHKHYKEHHKVRVQHVYRPASPPFVVPERIDRRHRADFRPYFAGDLYFRPHRHFHDIYVFPVRTRHGIVYREYEYCRGDLFIRSHLSYHGERVSFSIGF